MSQELAELSLQDNYLAGLLPSDWASEGHFTNLTKLDLHDNQLYGNLPASWEQWAILPDLSL